MAKRAETGRKSRGEAHASSQARRLASLPLSAHASARELAEINEQLLVEREELQKQTLELAEQTLALAELKEQADHATRAAEWLARVADENPDPVLRVSTDGTVQYRNPASLDLCRRWNAQDELEVPPDVQEVVAAACASMEVVRREFVFRKHTYLFTVAPSPPPANYASVFVRDITLRKRAETVLRDLNATLENKVAQRTAELDHRARQLQRLTLELAQTEERERRRMAEVLHDDLQQIIAAAKFNLSTVRSRVKHDASLQTTIEQVEQMLKEAIDKSRNLSHELSPAVLHHGDLTETLGWLAHQMRVKHGLVVRLHALSAVILPSDTITALLYRAVQELLFNVVKHARVHEATLRVRRRGPWVCLSVSDRGRGFDPQELQATAGYGLLSIRERLELLGGCMRIHSAPGRGSTVFLVVPDTPEDRGQKTEDAKETEEQALSSVLRVLLADDHRIVRESLRALLRDEPDVEIVGEAAHGREAVDLALRLEPDVVIMDVSMPLIDGDVATRRIKEHLPRARIVALSTYNEPETRAKMFRAGAESYVLKTASSEELLAAIRGQPAEGKRWERESRAAAGE